MGIRGNLAFAATIFTLIAGWFFYVGFAIPITVTTSAGDVANLQMMHLQSTDIAIGIGSAIISALFVVGAAIAR